MFLGWAIIFVLLCMAGVQAVAQTCVPAPAGLVSWWPGDGTTDDIVGGHQGTLVNGATFAPGLVGQAFSFDGVNAYVSVADAPDLNPTSAMTVEAWINPSGHVGSFDPVVKKAGEGFAQQDGYTLEFSGNGILFFVYLSGVGWISNSQPAFVPLGSWTHVAGVYDGAAIRLYVNGALVGAPRAAAGSIVPSSNELNIGRDPSNPGRLYQGLIDEIAIYNRALDAAEVQAIFNAGSAGKCTALTITTASLSPATVGSFASYQFEAALGKPPYIWSFVGGTLPPGLHLGANGVLDGTPSEAGTFSFSVRVTDSTQDIAEKTFRLQVLTLPICVPPPPGVIGWWPFDETSGIIAADIGGNHPGAYLGGPVPAPGEVGGALRVDGRGAFVGVGDSDLWAFGSRDFTLEFWVNFDALVSGSLGEPEAIFLGNDEGPGIRPKWFFALGGGMLEFVFDNTAHFLVFAPFAPRIGQWYHLALTRTGGLYTAFIDGTPVGSVIDPVALSNPNAPLTIGQAESIGFMHGRLDEVTIYNRALTEAEIQAIVDASSAGKCKNQPIAPAVISPSAGGDTGSVTVQITGSGFSAGATVKLVQAGYPDIVGNPVQVAGDGKTITTTFDLAGKARGLYDVVATNPDGTSTILPQSFTIEEGHAAQVWVDIVGRGAIRVGRVERFYLLYGNRGNVDAAGASVWITNIPKGAVVSPAFPPITEALLPTTQVNNFVAPVFEGQNEQMIPFTIFQIPPGFVGALGFDLTLNVAGTFNLGTLVVAP